MKNTIRFSFSLITLMLVASVCVWAGGGTDVTKSKDIVIGNYWEDWNAYTKDAAGDDNTALLIEWRKQIQEENGVKVQEKMIADWGNMLPLITQYVMAGRPPAQALRVTPDWAMTLKRQNLLAPISDSKMANLKSTTNSAKKQLAYDQNIANLFTFGGKQYAMAPIAGTGISGHETIIYFNKRLFREAGLDPDYLYDLQKSGNWTWNTFMEVCKKVTRDVNNNGFIDIYAFPSDHEKQVLDAFVYGNNADYVVRDASGKFVNASGRPEFIEALSFIERLDNEGVLQRRPEGSPWNWYETAFLDGKLAMVITTQNARWTWRFMKDDYGCVLPPKGPKATEYRVADDDNVIVVPATYKGDQLDLIMKSVELWLTPAMDIGLEGERQYYRDSRSINETLAMLGDPKYKTFRTNMLIPGLETGDIAWVMWWMYGNPAQLVESVSQKWDSLISDANKIK
ncbi:MAG: extracellular solute-binding protein [Treponema sp.]|jgi:ABC-type glycerol-3-phosphate transport system substrate-binding protein|nr:extracellular solute-binding protein [Treponema sp.]